MAKAKARKGRQPEKSPSDKSLEVSQSSKNKASQGKELEASAAGKASSSKGAEQGSSGFNPGAFIQGTKEELGKVVWPSRQQLISESLAVILMVSLSATIIYLVDALFGWAARQVF